MDGRRTFPRLLRAVALLAGACLAAAAALAGPAAAADSPATRWPAGGSTLRTAMSIGAEHWGMSPCGGRVAVRWDALGPATNAQSSWANDVDPYSQPSSNTACEIVLSLQVEWNWPKLCTVVVHEVGHLTGHPHAEDAEDVMYPTYVAPVAECATTPEPVETGAPVAAAPAAKPAAGAKEATVAKKRASAKKRAASKRTASKRAARPHRRVPPQRR